MLADAEVRSSFGPSALDPSSDRGGSRAVTDARGEASVSRPHDATLWELHVEAAGHFHHRSTRARGDDVLVRLARTTALSGIAVDAERGSPLAGAEVALVHDQCQGCTPDRARTDADGRFGLRAFPLGVDITLTARVEGYGDAQFRLHVLPEDDTRECRIALRRSTSFRLAVVDTLSGAPVASAQALPSRRSMSRRARMSCPRTSSRVSMRAPRSRRSPTRAGRLRWQSPETPRIGVS